MTAFNTFGHPGLIGDWYALAGEATDQLRDHSGRNRHMLWRRGGTAPLCRGTAFGLSKLNCKDHYAWAPWSHENQAWDYRIDHTATWTNTSGDFSVVIWGQVYATPSAFGALIGYIGNGTSARLRGWEIATGNDRERIQAYTRSDNSPSEIATRTGSDMLHAMARPAMFAFTKQEGHAATDWKIYEDGVETSYTTSA